GRSARARGGVVRPERREPDGPECHHDRFVPPGGASRRRGGAQAVTRGGGIGGPISHVPESHPVLRAVRPGEGTGSSSDTRPLAGCRCRSAGCGGVGGSVSGWVRAGRAGLDVAYGLRNHGPPGRPGNANARTAELISAAGPLAGRQAGARAMPASYSLVGRRDGWYSAMVGRAQGTLGNPSAADSSFIGCLGTGPLDFRASPRRWRGAIVGESGRHPPAPHPHGNVALIPRCFTRNASTSAASSICFEVGLPAPWPARVSTRINTGLSHACTSWSRAVNLNEWPGTTRSSWSAVVTSVAG